MQKEARVTLLPGAVDTSSPQSSPKNKNNQLGIPGSCFAIKKVRNSKPAARREQSTRTVPRYIHFLVLPLLLSLHFFAALDCPKNPVVNARFGELVRHPKSTRSSECGTTTQEDRTGRNYGPTPRELLSNPERPSLLGGNCVAVVTDVAGR